LVLQIEWSLCKIIYRKLGLNQIIGAIGSLITLASVVLALSNTVFGLSESNILTNTEWLFIYFANQWGQVLSAPSEAWQFLPVRVRIRQRVATSLTPIPHSEG
jgi:hypothetical protein